MHEFELINNYLKNLSKNSPSSLKLNDDVFFDIKKNLVVSVDTYVEKKHFINFLKPDLVIKKIIRSSISDLVCKGVYPKYYFISASGNKKNFSRKNLKKISSSLIQEQKKFKIFLGGGDTVYSDKLSFTVTSIGFSKKIVKRNNTKLNDDIYVTGNIGDSYIGLLSLKKKIRLSSNIRNYFENKYYKPIIQIKIIKEINKFANSSIDISDGLIADLKKIVNEKKFSYNIRLNDIPLSKYLLNLLKKNKQSKINYISKGDDYQILFTSNKSKRGIIKKLSKKLNIKITKIGSIQKNNQKSSIVGDNNTLIKLKYTGHFHKF